MKKRDIFDDVKRARLACFNARPYPANIIVYDLREPEGVQKVFPDMCPDLEGKNGLCSYMRRDGYNIILIGIRSKTGDTPALLAHECYHAMNVIYDWFGAWHDTDNDEAGAYFLADLVRQTSELLGWATRE